MCLILRDSHCNLYLKAELFLVHLVLYGECECDPLFELCMKMRSELDLVIIKKLEVQTIELEL